MREVSLRASIDIGSNSILLLVAQFSGEEVEVLESDSRITSLGYKLDETKVFHRDSLQLSYEALVEFKGICSRHKILPEDIIISATEASRVAENAKEFYLKIKKELNMSVNIITPEAEAFYSAKGILFKGNFKEDFIYALDVGGASSEVIKIDTKKAELVDSFSLPFGGVRASDWLESSTYNSKAQSIKTKFNLDLEKSSTKKVICVGGTVTSLACILKGVSEFSEDVINNSTLNLEDLDKLHSELSSMSPEEVLKRYNFLGKRSQSIVGGLSVISTILDWLGAFELKVLTYGLRYGTLLDGGIKSEYLVK